MTFKGIQAQSDSIETLDELKTVMKKFVDIDEFECVSNQINGEKQNWTFEPNNID